MNGITVFIILQLFKILKIIHYRLQLLGIYTLEIFCFFLIRKDTAADTAVVKLERIILWLNYLSFFLVIVFGKEILKSALSFYRTIDTKCFG